jgi:disulfide bond formation protein DsbB
MTPIRSIKGDAALLLLVAAIAALGGAYGSQYFAALAPCKLCLYQRWPWWIAGILAGLALFIDRPPIMRKYLLSLTGFALLVGTGIAVYHTGIEQHWWAGPASCSGGASLPATLGDLAKTVEKSAVVRCDEPAWTFLGISMAGYNAMFSAAAALIAFGAASSRRP